MNEALQNLKEWNELFENIVWGPDDGPRPSDFEKTFCQSNELIDLFFSHSRIAVHFMCNDGTVVFNVIPMKDFENWLEGDTDGVDQGDQ